tara:strand:- start:203 stop:739 length:537 start_codon:yes stop_codon:yes gene_type:complete
MTIHFGDSTSIDSGGSLGKIAQVVTATKDDTASFNHSTGSLSNLEGVFDISITPSSSSNKVLVRFSLTVGVANSTAVTGELFRKIGSGSETSLHRPAAAGSRNRITTGVAVNNAHNISVLTVEFLDSPNTTSACKYYLKLDQMTGTLSAKYLNQSHVDTNANSYARGTCHAIAMEVTA